MGERLAAWVPVVLIGLFAALTLWLDYAVQPAGRDPGRAARHEPDYIVDNLSAVRLDASGAARYTLSAAKMVHFPDDDSTHLANPRFASYGAQKAPVTITAKEGLVSSKGDDVYFQHDVRVVRAAYGEQSELVLETSFLHVIPDLNVAKTDRPVTIRNDAAVVTAVGLEMDSETRIVRLLSNVRGTYDPARAPRRGGGR